MGFERIFVERQVRDHPRTKAILAKLSHSNVRSIEKVEDVFGRIYKPYLQKRDNLNLFIGRKEGQLIKPAPPAYGTQTGSHYYFVHQYNCLYECEYCYLQGYFSSPDIVFFVNHEDIIEQIQELMQTKHQGEEAWFHAGEFSDCLSMSGLTEEWSLYWDCFRELPNAHLELRTKSANARPLAGLEPLPNVHLSFSLSPEKQAKRYDRRTPPTAARLRAASKLARDGHPIGLHLDPIIDCDDLEQQYRELGEQMLAALEETSISYVSLGVVRFSKDVFRQVRKNYPDSSLLGSDFVVGGDGKVRYSRPHRMHILNRVREIMIDAGISADKVYLCME